DEAGLEQLCSDRRTTGIGVILGRVSGGLACRDFDNEDAYRLWKNSHRALSTELPTAKTARGYHVFFRGPEGFENLGDGEYRADSGHYVVAPPSWHPNRLFYEWLIPARPTRGLPWLNPHEEGLTSKQVRPRSERKRDFTPPTISPAVEYAISACV